MTRNTRVYIYIMHTCVTRSSLDPFPSQRTLGVETDSGNLVNRNNKARKAGSSSFSRDGRGVHKVICASATSARTSKKFGLPAPPTLAHRRSVQLVSRSFRPLSTNISYILYISCITHSYIRVYIYIHTHIHIHLYTHVHIMSCRPAQVCNTDFQQKFPKRMRFNDFFFFFLLHHRNREQNT